MPCLLSAICKTPFQVPSPPGSLMDALSRIRPAHVDGNTVPSNTAPTSHYYCLYTLHCWIVSIQRKVSDHVNSSCRSWPGINPSQGTLQQCRCPGLSLDLLNQIPAAKYVAHLGDSRRLASGIGGFMQENAR